MLFLSESIMRSDNFLSIMAIKDLVLIIDIVIH